MVQWLRIRLPMQGTWVRALVGEPRFHMGRENGDLVSNGDRASV